MDRRITHGKKIAAAAQPAVPAGERKDFRKGDTVIYGANGVCEIDEITTQSFCGEDREYYVLRSVYCAGETVFVPTDNAALTGKMYPALTRDEIDGLLNGLPADAPAWIESDDERKNRFAEILTSGDRAALIGMIRTLYAHREKQEKKGKKLHLADERSFREGEKLLNEEFAHVLQIQPGEVADYIREKLGA
ncbi:MAG: CarD family transcriptional regulator [Ruminococcaceae bacterium]|nr:CarD family transcriptional regulator [Oscillospiraceae bacterium]